MALAQGEEPQKNPFCPVKSSKIGFAYDLQMNLPRGLLFGQTKLSLISLATKRPEVTRAISNAAVQGYSKHCRDPLFVTFSSFQDKDKTS